MMKTTTALFPVLAAVLLQAGPAAAVSTTPPTPSGAPSADTSWKTDLSAGLGYDTNVFRSPDRPFTDYSLAVPVLVDPQPRTGLYLPLFFRTRYDPGEGLDRRMLGSLHLEGDVHFEEGQSDADTYLGRLRLGEEWTTARREKASDSFYAGLFAAHRKEAPGFDSETSAALCERYTALGAEGSYRNRNLAAPFRVKGLWESRAYAKKSGLVPPDQNRLSLGLEAEVPLAHGMDLVAGYDFLQKDYTRGHAHELTGDILSTNPLRTYTYNTVAAGIQTTPARRIDLDLAVERTTRAENHLGYNDYTEDGVRLMFAAGDARGGRVRVSARSWKRDYDRAWAYDNPASGERKSYRGTEATLKGEMGLANGLTGWLEVGYTDQEAADKRYDYTRTRALAGVSWEP
jgi:hypothetical protein